MTTPPSEPGERRPRLERPPSDRYGVPAAATDPTAAGGLDAVLVPVAIALAGTIAIVVLGGILDVTAGLVVVAAFLGWLTGRLVSPPARAASVGLGVVAVGVLGIWLFGRFEGGVLDPVTYLLEVEGAIVVLLSLVAAGGLAAAASR